MVKVSFMTILVCKGLSNDDVGVARGTVLQEVRPGAGFKISDSVNEKLGGLPWNDSFELRMLVVSYPGLRVSICTHSAA